MCDRCANNELKVSPEKRFRLSEFFDANWEKYLAEDDVKVSIAQFKAASAIRVCRTAILGVDYYACEDCGEVVEIYHNCRNRFCPTCSWGDTIKWASRLKDQMMALPHRHVVFTLPHALIPLIKSNGKELLNTLLRTAADTFKDWVEHKYQLKIGVISVLHTFGETKEYHPHVHMIVSWGGIDFKTKELKPIKGLFVNYKFLKDKFQNKFEDVIVQMYNSGKLLHKFEDRIDLNRFLKRINKKSWAIHLEPPMANPTAVIRYIGRYSKRACISEYKITDICGEHISFKYKDYKTIDTDNKPVVRELKLHYKEFFPRLLQHVPLPYFRLVRYYGLYATKSKIPQEHLNKNSETEQEEGEWENPFVCNVCNKPRVYMYTILDIRTRRDRTEPFNYKIHPYFAYKRA